MPQKPDVELDLKPVKADEELDLQPVQPQDTGWLGSVRKGIKQFITEGIPAAAKQVGEFGKGAGIQLGQMGSEVAPIISKGITALGGTGSAIPSFPRPQNPNPQNPAQMLGYSLTGAAAQMMPFGKVGKALMPGSPLMGNALAEMLGTAGVTGLQTGSPEDAAMAAGLVGATSLAGRGLTKLMGGAGRKITMTTIRPRAVDYRAMPGKDVENAFYQAVSKHGISADVGQAYAQVEDKLNQLRQARKPLVSGPTGQVDMNRIFSDALNEVHKSAYEQKLAGVSDRVKDALIKMQQDMFNSRQGNMVLDLEHAENAKEALGLLGLWNHGAREDDAKVGEHAANVIYSKVREAIEAASPSGTQLAALNKQMSELLPIKHAIIARLPVDERNRMLSLTQQMGLFGILGLNSSARFFPIIASTLQKSGRFADLLRFGAKTPSGGLTTAVKGVIGSTADQYDIDPETYKLVPRK